MEYAAKNHGPRADGPIEILATWLYVTTNGSPGLLVLASAGAALGWRRGLIAARLCARLFLLLLLGIAVVTIVTGTLDVGLMRHLLPALPIAVLFQAGGLYALYRERKWLGALLCLWVIAGLAFAGHSNWQAYIQGRIRSYTLPPWHLISRVARHSEDSARVIAYMMPQKTKADSLIRYPSLIEYWFTSRDVEITWVGSARWLEEYLHHYEGTRHLPWVLYQPIHSDEIDLAEMAATMDALGYRPCQQASLPAATEMIQYSWIALNCQPARVRLSAETESLRYDLYGAELSPSGLWLIFADQWAGSSEAPLESLSISYQLVSEDGLNVTQLDSPLQPDKRMRQHGMDVSEVPPGSYLLMGVVYDPETGERRTWRGQDAEMLNLGEIVISKN